MPMDRLTLWIRILLGLGFALSGAALAQESLLAEACGACSVAGSASLPVVGMAFYGLLLAASILLGPGALVGSGIALAVAAHGSLAGYMFVEGRTCLLCLAAAINAFVLFGLSLARDPDNLIRSVIVIPIGALAIPLALLLAGGVPSPSFLPEAVVSIRPDPAGSAIPGQVRIVVFEQKDCPYCEELRDRLAPAITSEFGSNVGWSFRKASEMPGIRNTPTVVVLPPHGKGGAVFEGLPTHQALAAAVREQFSAVKETHR